MTKDEALKMAIDWIEKETRSQYTYVDILEACKEALEQPAQEPVAWINVEERKLEWAKHTVWNTATTGAYDKLPLYIHPATSCSCKDKK